MQTAVPSSYLTCLPNLQPAIGESGKSNTCHCRCFLFFLLLLFSSYIQNFKIIKDTQQLCPEYTVWFHASQQNKVSVFDVF